jgi:large subunit ribosomal protein L35e
VLTIINEKAKTTAVEQVRNRYTEVVEDGKKVKKLEKTIKNLKFKHLPLNLRPKKTRAIRRRLTKHEAKLLPLRVLKRKLNFKRRTFSVPL